MDRDDDVELISRETPFQGYFRIDRYTLRHRTFDGGWTGPLTREVFERGHAVAVLPYDPRRDRVVLLEQFRAAPYVEGDHPWLIEVVAGIVEDGEDAETVAHRESQEEAGLTLQTLKPIMTFYTSPGGTTETIKLYVGRVDSTHATGLHGLADEGEDIRVFTWTVDEALAELARGRITNGPAIIALQWLALNRVGLRKAWAG